MVIVGPPVIPYYSTTTVTNSIVVQPSPSPTPPNVWKNNEVAIKPPDPLEGMRKDEGRRRDKQQRKSKRVYWRR